MKLSRAFGAFSWPWFRNSRDRTTDSMGISWDLMGFNIHRIRWWENLQESPIFDGKNQLFLWPCSIAFCKRWPEGISINIPVLSHYHPYKTIFKGWAPCNTFQRCHEVRPEAESPGLPWQPRSPRGSAWSWAWPAMGTIGSLPKTEHETPKTEHFLGLFICFYQGTIGNWWWALWKPIAASKTQLVTSSSQRTDSNRQAIEIRISTTIHLFGFPNVWNYSLRKKTIYLYIMWYIVDQPNLCNISFR